MWSLVRRTFEGRKPTYGRHLQFQPRVRSGTESKAKTPDGMLIIVNRHQADPNDISGDNFVATGGGLGAILVGMAFLVAACLHWRFCARRSAAPSDRRQSARLTFSRPESARSTAVPY